MSQANVDLVRKTYAAFDWGDRVLILLEASAKGSGSGVEVRKGWVQAATMRDGLVYRVEPYPDLESAREALGPGE